jgi:phosphopantothenoylcysteine synthetase/decarboxylase
LQDELNFVLQYSKTDKDTKLENNEDMKEAIVSLYLLFKMSKSLVNSPLQLSNSHERVLPSVEQASKLELKALPKHLKYVYLGKDETFLVIIANDLTKVRKEKLLRVLKEHNTRLGRHWRT